jgi:CelD/BcsL family acetyltransferase involved in cellulose biosynthesis
MRAGKTDIELSDTLTDLQDSEKENRADSRIQPSLEIVRDVKEMEMLRQEWDSLCTRTPSTVYQSFDWLYLWWKHFGNDTNRTLHIVVVRIDKRISGIFPLILETKQLFGIKVNSVLRFLGCGVRSSHTRGLFDHYSPSDFLDAIIDPAFASQTVRAFISHLTENSTLWDELLLEEISDDSIFRKELTSQLEEKKIGYSIRKSDICPRLNAPASMKEYLSSLSSGVRRRFSQARKLESETSSASIESIGSAQELDTYLSELITLHQSRWNALGYVGAFSDARFVGLQKDILHAFYAHDRIWFKRVRIDGATVASRMGFKFNEKLYDYLSGFSDQMASSKIRPGLALLLSMIEDASAWQYQTVEFLRGAEPYKFELTSVYTSLAHVYLANPGAGKSIRHHVAWMLKLYESVRYRFLLEFLTLGVHYKQYGIPVFLIRYLNFRLKKYFNTKG